MEDALSWDRVDELALDFRMKKDSTFQRTVVLPRSRNPRSTDNPRLTAGAWSFDGEPLVQWDNPISIEENEEVLAKLGTFPGVNVYYLTDSFLGNRVWAADFLPPQSAALRLPSQAECPQADSLRQWPGTCQRGLQHESHPETGGAPGHGFHVSGDAEEGERGSASRHQPGRRVPGLCPSAGEPRSHASCRSAGGSGVRCHQWWEFGRPHLPGIQGSAR